ncbi:MAG TPA: nucleotide disphospho-sugar-binding domain-containing protein, partial [Tepidisphaeraceae bacterium]|nr:nucleotide disphospho-sugar-binding domain-containing protein [Tepidisphaeraceae bacterium]
CRRLGRRGLLLTRFAEQVPTDLPPGVIHVPFAPFSQLLPRCAALVHHGGIGTTSQGLAAGVPQLVMPMSHDQPDNALRVMRLGVGDALAPRWFTGRRVAARLGALLGSADVRRRCADVVQKFGADDGIARACDLIESLATRTHGTQPHPAPTAA